MHNSYLHINAEVPTKGNSISVPKKFSTESVNIKVFTQLNNFFLCFIKTNITSVLSVMETENNKTQYMPI